MLFPRPNTLPCGCRHCGCVCPEHSGFGAWAACPAHDPNSGGWLREVGALISLALFIGLFAVLGVVFGG